MRLFLSLMDRARSLRGQLVEEDARVFALSSSRVFSVIFLIAASVVCLWMSLSIELSVRSSLLHKQSLQD